MTLRSLFLMTSLFAVQVAAQPVCPTDPFPRCRAEKCKCMPGVVGDPVNMMAAQSIHVVKDVSIDVGNGGFELWRYYSSSPGASFRTGGVYPSSAKGPFGMLLTTLPPLVPYNPQWSHDLFSFVDATSALNVFVFEGNMTWSQYKWTPTTFGFLSRSDSTPGHVERLEHLAGTPESFRFIRDDGQQWIYGGTANSVSGSIYYLSEVRSRTGQALYAVQYSTAGLSCGGGQPIGPPFIEKVTFPAGGWLDFFYTTANGQCALATISWRSSASAPVTVVAGYTYGTAPGKISTGGPIAAPESYVHWGGGAGLDIKAPGGRIKAVHNYNTGGQVNWLGGQGNERNASVAVPSPLGSYSYADGCSPDNATLQQAATFSGMASAASGMPNSLTSIYYTFADQTLGGDHTAAFKAREDICPYPALGFCSAGTVTESRVGATPGSNCTSTAMTPNPVTSLFRKDKRGYWTGEIKQWNTPGGDVYPTATTRGATAVQVDPLLGDRLEYTRLNYPAPTYTNGIRLSDSRQAPSSLNPLGTPNYSNARDEFDASGFKLRSLFSGWTKGFDGILTYKTRGTFYSTARVCGAPFTADAVGRTLRVEGPCWTTNNTSCSDSSYPLTEFFYYGAGATEASGRLWKVVRYPEYVPGTCGTALTTEYLAYSPEGLPTQVKDEAGVTTTYTYVNGRIATRSVAGMTPTTYTYEADGALRSIQHPQGNYEVFCRYGTTADTSCPFPVPPNGALQQPRVVWKAKSGSSNGSGWSERVEYEYWPDGSLRWERSKDSIGAVRSKRAVYRDAHGRVTYETSGNDYPSTGTVGINRSFDAADNTDAIGPSFTGAPNFCRIGGLQTGAASPLCAWMTYDGANRLARVDLNPTGAVSSTESIRTCFDYDLQGRLRKMSPGCATTSACSFSGGGYNVTNCPEAPGVDYETDDFGNVVRVSTPWSSVPSYGTTYYDFDARGNLLKKQTEQMRSVGALLLFNYDRLNRLKSAYGGTSGGYHLFTLGYDAALADPGCPTMTNVGGRLAFRYDSFGYTWYSYTAQGWVDKEVRQRLGTSGSCAMNYANNPSTYYTYTPNGNVSQITYPYGRPVTFSYGTGGYTDRVDTVWVKYWPGSGTAKATSRRLITNIAWEPYGGLRGYHYLTGATNADPTSVEYFRSDINESVNTSNLCGVSSLSAAAPDGTGRTRALWLTSPAAALGAGTGNVLKQFYTWSGDQLVGEQTCFSTLGQSNEHYQSFGYDKTARLTSAGGAGMPVRTSGPNANVYSRTYSYDRRGNRTGWSVDNCQRYNQMGTSNQLDFLSMTWPNSGDPGCNGQWGANAYYYDKDGNTTRIGGGWAWWAADMSYPTILSSDPVGGLDSVFKSVLITGAPGTQSGNYQYFYDAFNRRRAKVFPFDAKEEYFYDLSHQMLSNVAGNLLGPATEWTIDDYVWLDGRPIAMVRGSFSTAWVRNSDAQASCNRLGETGKCGVYHLVTDYLPKPVMMVESTTNLVTNAALYDEFGHVNRTPLIAGLVGYTWGTVGTVSNPQGGNVDARVRFNYVDLPTSTNVTMTGSGGAIGWSATFADKARVWSPWVAQGTDPTVTVGLTSYALWEGLMSEFVEYRRYTAGATPTWTPLRFPGQFHDPETDLFENWNRYYEPWTGRYLQPEPLLNAAGMPVIRSMSKGLVMDVFGYAGNNPLRWADPTGLLRITDYGRSECPNFDRAVEIARSLARCSDDGNTKSSCQCQKEIQRCTRGCDICAFLQPGRGPMTTIDAVYDQSYLKVALRVASLHLNPEECKNPAAIGELVNTLFHELTHACELFAFGAASHGGGHTPDGMDCDPYNMEKECTRGMGL